MLSVFVLEDKLLQQSRIENVIQELIAQKSLQCKPPKIFGKPHQLVEAITERGSHQLFFLDIEIKGEEKKGLDIAKEIRKKDPNATIVFVTTHSEFMPITFKYKVAAARGSRCGNGFCRRRYARLYFQRGYQMVRFVGFAAGKQVRHGFGNEFQHQRHIKQGQGAE